MYVHATVQWQQVVNPDNWTSHDSISHQCLLHNKSMHPFVDPRSVKGPPASLQNQTYDFESEPIFGAVAPDSEQIQDVGTVLRLICSKQKARVI
jgi:hypothetical protein